MTDIDLLQNVLTKTGQVVAGVDRDQWTLPTPCTEMDVEELLGHIVGWMQAFAAGANEEEPPADPGAYRVGDDPVGEYESIAAHLVAGWEEHGFDRTVSVAGGSMPAPLMFNMTVMEYLGHGWDLATATGQAPPYTEEEAEAVLARARETLPPEYQGDGQAFGSPVPVADDAPAIDRYVGFLGRDPEHPIA